jgi:aminopeptidase N
MPKMAKVILFLREVVLNLDKLNPQVAARMVKPLTSWQRYSEDRQKRMQEQLQLILEDNLISNDLYEIVNKSLQ